MKLYEKLAARNANAGANPPVLMAFIGDSVTHGCFEVYMDHKNEIGVCCQSGEGYPYRLKQKLDQMYPAAALSILNAGVSGETAVEGAKRLERDVLSRNPDAVVVAFALNDSMNPDVEAGLAAYRGAMRDMLSRIRERGAECIVLTPNHMCAYVPGQVTQEPLREIAAHAARVQNDGVLARYVQAAREVAAECGAYLADAYAIWDRMQQCGADTTALLSNHINHPTRDAHDIFVQALLNVILANTGTGK